MQAFNINFSSYESAEELLGMMLFIISFSAEIALQGAHCNIMMVAGNSYVSINLLQYFIKLLRVLSLPSKIAQELNL